MRVVAALALVFAVSAPAFAQSAPSQKESLRKAGTIKLWSGIGGIALGAIFAIDSHQSASTTVPGLGTISASTTNTGELATGIVLIGAGGYFVWDGLNNRKEADAMKSTRFMVAPSAHGVGGFIRKTW